MKLDLIIPTFNRSASLERTLQSILKMPVPGLHSVSVTVADNNSTDTTRQTVKRVASFFQGRLHYVLANRGQGRPFALNAGIKATNSDLVAFVDDDEEVDSRWAETAFKAFEIDTVDYIGGRYEPVWQVEPPAWVNHRNTRAGLGWVDFGPAERSFGEDGFEGCAVGGNTVIRRKCLDRVGLYAERSGRIPSAGLVDFSSNLLGNGAEDTDMNMRLLAAGFRGRYLPNLIVFHHIPAARITKRYMRRWAFWSSVSTGRIMLEHPQAGQHWFGLPRWMYGQLLRSPFQLLESLIAGDPAAIFNHELTVWRFGGLFYGLHLFEKQQR